MSVDLALVNHTNYLPGHPSYLCPPEPAMWRYKYESCDELCPSEYLFKWHHLVAHNRYAEPFYQPEWFRASVQTHARFRPRYLVSAWEGEDLRAVLPLMYDNQLSRGIPARVLRSLSWIHSCRFDLMHDGTDINRSAGLIWDGLRNRDDWDVLEFQDVPSNGALNYLLKHALEDDYLLYVWPTRRSPALTLPREGDPYKNCPKGSRRYRARIKSKFKKLSQMGEITLDVRLDDPQRTFEEFVELESRGWKGKNGSAIGSHATVFNFYEEIVQTLSRRGIFMPYALRLNGKPIAMHFGLQWHGTYYTPKLTYDESYAKYSPGQVLIHRLIPELMAQDVVKLDFLGPTAPWKSVWANDYQAHHDVHVIRPSVYGRVMCLLPLKGMKVLRSIRDLLCGDPQGRRL